MRNRSRALGVLLALFWAPSALAFEFVPPPGWRDLSSKAPVENFKDIPQELVTQALRGDHAYFAVDPLPGTRGFYASFAARIHPESAVVSLQFVDGFIKGLSGAVAKQGLRYEVKERAVTTVDGIEVGRLIGELFNQETLVARQLVYVLPGATQMAIVVYASAPEDFDRYLPAFEESARATRGVSRRSLWHWLKTNDQAHYLLGKISGYALVLAIALAVVLRVRRR